MTEVSFKLSIKKDFGGGLLADSEVAKRTRDRGSDPSNCHFTRDHANVVGATQISNAIFNQNSLLTKKAMGKN